MELTSNIGGCGVGLHVGIMEDQKDCLVKQFINNSSLNKKCLRLQILRELLEQVKDKSKLNRCITRNNNSFYIRCLKLYDKATVSITVSDAIFIQVREQWFCLIASVCYSDGISLCLVRDILKELCAIES